MKKVFKILFFILLGIGVIWTFAYLFKKSKPQETVYEIVEARIDTVQKSTVVTGKIEPRDEVSMKPQVSGIIAEILNPLFRGSIEYGCRGIGLSLPVTGIVVTIRYQRILIGRTIPVELGVPFQRPSTAVMRLVEQLPEEVLVM